jgi:hypothetical protein
MSDETTAAATIRMQHANVTTRAEAPLFARKAGSNYGVARAQVVPVNWAQTHACAARAAVTIMFIPAGLACIQAM